MTSFFPIYFGNLHDKSLVVTNLYLNLYLYHVKDEDISIDKIANTYNTKQ